MKEKITLPKDFFTKVYKIISFKEALKDIEPIDWPKDVLNGKSKVILNKSNILTNDITKIPLTIEYLEK